MSPYGPPAPPPPYGSYPAPGGYRPLPPPVPPPPRKPFLSTAKGMLTVLGTLVAIAGTVITTLFAIQDRPAPYRLTDWAQSANAACDTKRASVSDAFGRVDTAIRQALSATPPDLEAAAQEVEAAPSYYKQMVGALRGIKLPSQRRSDVTAAFGLTDELDQRYYDVADLIRRLDPADLTAQPLQSQLAAAFDRVDQQWAVIADAWRSLGASSCAINPS